MRIVNIEYRDVDGTLLWSERDIPNVLHSGGEQFILQALFTGGPTNSFIPPYFFVGLDNRSTLTEADVMSGLVGEPSGNGYQRQSVSSTTGFTVAATGSGNWMASTSAVTFLASGGSWGPVQNVFLSNLNTTSGVLISSASLGNPFTVTPGQTVTLKLGMTLKGSC